MLLFAIGWIVTLKADLFKVFGQGISGKDIILILSGLFLIYKATKEIHDRLERVEGHASAKVAPTFATVTAQVLILDLVFSVDFVITPVGISLFEHGNLYSLGLCSATDCELKGLALAAAISSAL